MRSDQCHGEPKTAAEIIPDTSKYADLPSKLRAFAEIMESEEHLQVRIKSESAWVSACSMTPEVRVRSMMEGNEYRLKPKPRELWAIYQRNNTFWAACSRREEAEMLIKDRPSTQGLTVVLMVEPSE